MIALLLSLASAQDLPGDPDYEEPALVADLLRPALGASRTTWVDDPARVDGFVAEADVGVVSRPLVYVWPDGSEIVLVEHATVLRLGAARQLGPVRIGASMPAYVVSGELSGVAVTVGDPAVEAFVVALDGATRPVGVGVLARFQLPFGGGPRHVGYPGVVGELAAVGDVDLGPAFLAACVGVRVAPATDVSNAVQDDVVLLRGAAGVEIADRGVVAVEIAGQAPFRPVGGGFSTPFELLLSGRVQADARLAVRAAVGTGIAGGIGAPLVRALAGVEYR